MNSSTTLTMTTKNDHPNTDDQPTTENQGIRSKPIVVVAALQEGKIKPKTEINCENGAFPFGGKVIRDHQKYGNLTFDEILMKSSNIGAAKMSLMLTGTSQAITPDGHYSEYKYVTSFAGFFPVDHPKYVCVVVVDQADLKPEKNYGGLVAAPIFASIVEKTAPLLGINRVKNSTTALNQ